MAKERIYDLQKRLVSFSARVIDGASKLSPNYATEHLIKQLIRSTTSAALNYGEAQAAESKKDFVHKMKLCLKELRESQVNCQILKEANLTREEFNLDYLLDECGQLVAIFSTSIKTTKTQVFQD